jgi:RNA polymerase sigma factor (sigma-70 family)
MDLETLLRAARDGKPGAWKALFLAVNREVRRYFLREFDEPTATDLTQRTAEILTRQLPLPGVVPDESFSKWVFGIARNLRRKEHESRTRSKALDELADVLQRPNMSPSASLYAEEARTILREEIDKLPPHYRAVMKNDLKGRDIRKFAKRQNIPLRTAYSRRARAMEILQERLSPRLPQPLQLPELMADVADSMSSSSSTSSSSSSPPPP